MTKKILVTIFLLTIGFAAGVLLHQTDRIYSYVNQEEEHSGFVQDKVLSNSENFKRLLIQTGHLPSPVKNLIFIIGDGMGPQQIEFARLYAKKAPHSVVPGRQRAIEKFMDMGETGMVGVEPYDKLVPDSACSATQFSTGQYCRSEMIGLNARGDPVPTILELAKLQGKSTGLVSDKRLTDATPAAYAAHQLHRSMENEIAVDMLTIGPDVMLAGGLGNQYPQGETAEPGLDFGGRRFDGSGDL